MGFAEAFYMDKITSFILLSSDSDFWNVISSLPNANFLVMVEHNKCDFDIIDKLIENKTYYCYIDDFCTANIGDFKNLLLRSELYGQIVELIEIDTLKLLDDIFFNLRLDVTSVEKQNFYNKYIKKLSLEIDEDHIFKTKIPD